MLYVYSQSISACGRMYIFMCICTCDIHTYMYVYIYVYDTCIHGWLFGICIYDMYLSIHAHKHVPY